MPNEVTVTRRFWSYVVAHPGSSYLIYSVLWTAIMLGCGLTIKQFRMSKFFIYYVLILCSLQTMLSSLTFAMQGFPLLPVPLYFYLQTTFFLQLLSLVKPQLKPWWYRWTLVLPSFWYMAASFFSLPLIPLMLLLPLLPIPCSNYIFALALFASASFALYQSVRTVCPDEVVDVDFTKDRPYHTTLARLPGRPIRTAATAVGLPPPPGTTATLKLFQFTDTHLGSCMPVHRLKAICERVVKKVRDGEVDMVVLTGDFLTREAQGDADEDALREALSPLKQINGKTFACLGNHDYEKLNFVKKALKDNDIVLLVDEEIVVDTVVGPVQIIGSKFKFGNHEDHIRNLCRKYPKRPEAKLRLILVHNPSTFEFIPPDDDSLVLCGHYHGGQIGLLYPFGLNLTLLDLFARYLFKKQMPDHGVWALGRNRCYPHRGTGHYGFPLRFGVPSEESVMRVHI